MKQIKGLIDISVCSLGFSGIPQDTRRNFSMLKGKIDLDGLIFNETIGLKKNKFSLLKKTHAKEKLISSTSVLTISGKEAEYLTGNSQKIARKTKVIRRFLLGGFMQILVPSFKTSVELLCSEYDDFFWKRFFSKTLPVADKGKVDNTIIKVSSVSKAIIHVKTLIGFGLKIDTKDYDFVLFSEPTIVAPTKGTIKIIRFHDAIPLTHPHLINDTLSVKYTFNTLARCVEDGSIFCCNSDESQKVLHSLFPERQIKSYVIPCAISDRSFPNYEGYDVSSIVRKYSSFSSLGGLPLEFRDIANIDSKLCVIPDDGYIITIANIDPKKNQQALISAWDRYRSIYKSNVKLIMVSSVGWDEDGLFKKMKKHVMHGDLIHLENVSGYDLTALLSQAKAFVFPSIVEGFGLGNLEAARCKCPVITSDIPAHRYVMHENAFYFNPHSVAEMVDKIAFVLDNKNVAQVSKVVDSAFSYSERFFSSNVATIWEEMLFDNIK